MTALAAVSAAPAAEPDSGVQVNGTSRSLHDLLIAFLYIAGSRCTSHWTPLHLHRRAVDRELRERPVHREPMLQLPLRVPERRVEYRA